VFVPSGDVQESWRWIRDLAAAAGAGEAARWQTLDDVVDAIAQGVPALAAIRDAAPPASFRIAGRKIAREPGRYSGRTAKYAGMSIREPKPPPDPDTPLTFTMEGFEGQPPPALIPRFWAPGWNSVQSVNFYQTEVGASLRGGDPGQRAMEPATDARPAYFDPRPEPFAPVPGELLGVPLYHIFGSEELSVSSPGIAGRAPAPYVALNAGDLQRAGLAHGDEVIVTASGRDHPAIARLLPSLPPGVAGVPAGLPSMPGIRLPALVRIARAAP
jgi:NADH-quinone oxidoreductase subunit G